MTCFRADSWRSNLNNFPPSTFTRYLKKDYLYDCSILFRNKAPERRSVKRSAWLAKTKHCWNLKPNLFSCENHESPLLREKKINPTDRIWRPRFWMFLAVRFWGKSKQTVRKTIFLWKDWLTVLQTGFFSERAIYKKRNAKLESFMRFYQVIQFFLIFITMAQKESDIWTTPTNSALKIT